MGIILPWCDIGTISPSESYSRENSPVPVDIRRSPIPGSIITSPSCGKRNDLMRNAPELGVVGLSSAEIGFEGSW